jgi:signal transduction histidine kinase
MDKHIAPVSVNERERLVELASFDLDYSDLDESLKDLTKLAAKVAGTDISHLSLVDSFTNWAFACHGFAGGPSPKEDSLCQYTILEDDYFEVPDMLQDERFRDQSYVTGDPHFRYYLGFPLQTQSGYNLGALCVLHTEGKEISPENRELLRIIAKEAMGRLTTMKMMQDLRSRVRDTEESQRKVAHDIRGPLGGIIGLTQIITEQGTENSMSDVLEFVGLIRSSSNSLLEMADQILHAGKSKPPTPTLPVISYYNLELLRAKLDSLYAPQAKNKEINFDVSIKTGNRSENFSQNKLLQIIGNLVSNALKFTPKYGFVGVELELLPAKLHNTLVVTVKDTGVGLDANTIQHIKNGSALSSQGTGGEKGFGFGLSVVRQLVDEMQGVLQIDSGLGGGALFQVRLNLERIF